jgi:hypothetical protein
MNDHELINRINDILKRYLADQLSSDPLHLVKDLPSEVHGELMDFISIDKVRNTALVSLLITLFNVRERSDEEIMTLVKDLQSSLQKMVDYNKEHPSEG